MARDYDVIVIGSGPGGEGAAMKAVKSGLRVATVCGEPRVGGSCTHCGTIPSKALRHAVEHLDPSNRFDDGFPELLATAKSVIDRQVTLRSSFYNRNGVTLHKGLASFVDAHTVRVLGDLGAEELITADHFVIATGSRPWHPDDIDFSHPRLLDSRTVLGLKETPRVITIYGAGVIGCEYASIFRGLGVKVNLINTRDQLLSFLDDEIIDALSYHMREQGILIRHNESFDHIEADNDGVVVHLKSRKQIKGDYMLWAQGRSGNANELGLDAVGVEVNHRGHIQINDHYQTSQEHIYAVGDVVGFPSLASAAYDQGRFAATHLVDGHCDVRLVKDIPTGIYTIPEISSVGATEKELTAEQVPYEVGQAHFRTLARAQISNRTTGMLKLLFHRETLALLGVHCFGDRASEIIHIGQAIMSQTGGGNTLEYFINTTFNYPTMAEAYRVAALNGMNRV